MEYYWWQATVLSLCLFFSELVTNFHWKVLEPFSIIPESGTLSPQTSCNIKATFSPKVYVSRCLWCALIIGYWLITMWSFEWFQCPNSLRILYWFLYWSLFCRQHWFMKALQCVLIVLSKKFLLQSMSDWKE